MKTNQDDSQERIRASKAAYERRRRKVLVAYANLHEYAEVKRAARAAGLPLSTYLRRAERAYRRQSYLVPKDMVRRQEKITSLLLNIGNSLNQVAKFTTTLQKKKTWFGRKPFDWKEAEAKVRKLEQALWDFIHHPPRDSDKPS